MRLECDEMPDDWEDPIVAEIHEIRQRIMAEFNHDLGAYMEHLTALEEDERRRGRKIVDLPAKAVVPPADAF